MSTTAMRYTYKAAWAVVGGISLSAQQSVELYQSERCRFVLTNEVDTSLEDVDRATALAGLTLQTIFLQQPSPEAVAVEAEMARLRDERAKKIDGHAVLLMEANGETYAEVSAPSVEHEGYIVAFRAFNKHLVKQSNRSAIEAMKVAIALESSIPPRFSLLSEDVYVTNERGKRVYSFSASFAGEASVSAELSAGGANRISVHYRSIVRASEMPSVQRLYSQMADYRNDRLRLLSGWNALEIFIGKAFNIYEPNFLSTSAAQPMMRERFLARREGMKKKYALVDKFLLVAAVLFPYVPDSDVEQHLDKFMKIKRLRDKISHGEKFSELDLPIHELAFLLRKHLIAYIERR